MNPARQLSFQVLERLLANDTLKSQHEKYLDEHFRNSTNDFWYTKTLKSEGKAAAEAELENWVKQQRLKDFAEGIELVSIKIREHIPSIIAFMTVQSCSSSSTERYPAAAACNRPAQTNSVNLAHLD